MPVDKYKSPLFLAIDQSTSATKALLFDAACNLIDRHAIEHAQFYPQPGWVEHDASEIRTNCHAAIKALLSRNPAAVQCIQSVSITNQRETVLVFNRQSGEPLCRAMVWQCRRGVDLCAAQQMNGMESTVRNKTGLCIDAYFSASKLHWLMRNDATCAAALRGGTAVIGTFDCFLIHALTRGKVFATDATNACRTLLFDIHRLCWDSEMLEIWGAIPTGALPEVRDCSATFGKTDLFGLLPHPVPIQGVMGDSHASLLAHRCVHQGDVKATIGTGSSIMLNAGPQPRKAAQGVMTTLAWVINGQAVYAYEGIIICAAAALTWLRDQLGIIDDVAAACNDAARLRDNGGVYMVPAFTGMGLPHWQASARAAIVGLTSQSNRLHVVRAALESIAFQLQDAVTAMSAGCGFNLHSVHMDGGSTNNAFLVQLIADLTQVNLTVPLMTEYSSLGAVLAGRLGSGSITSFEQLCTIAEESTSYSPAMQETQRQNLLAGWTTAVRQTIAGVTAAPDANGSPICNDNLSTNQ